MTAPVEEHSQAPAPPPTVSVVIPCYEQAGYLSDAVESVVAQTYRDWEIVIVDDGSPDDTATVTEQLISANRDRRIRLIRQSNRGLSGARNVGIAAATGRYILPLDADDILEPEMLEQTVAVLESEPAVSIVYTDFRLFDAEDRDVPAGVWSIDELSWSNQLLASALFRRTVWESVGGYDESMRLGYEDWDFWIGAAERGFVGRRIPRVLFRNRVKRHSMVTEAWRRRRWLRRQIARNHPAVYTPWRRARFSVRRALGATRYWVGRLAGRLVVRDTPRAS